ncbi:hypothetical protein GX51_02084 [Blastomyces parvus]|uniref:Uncharacterized protein n=1 Tax=Blastomyces parvus TaxID=2060905 RepID=A0A2B7X5W1_9EURO|nr:hypothetical protein GX51_02084 [Blastomyces parvus]
MVCMVAGGGGRKEEEETDEDDEDDEGSQGGESQEQGQLKSRVIRFPGGGDALDCGGCGQCLHPPAAMATRAPRPPLSPAQQPSTPSWEEAGISLDLDGSGCPLAALFPLCPGPRLAASWSSRMEFRRSEGLEPVTPAQPWLLPCRTLHMGGSETTRWQ